MGLLKTLNDLLSSVGIRLSRVRSHKEERLRRNVLMHSWTGQSPTFTFEFPMFTPIETDFVIAERVIDAFHSAREAEADQTSGAARVGHEGFEHGLVSDLVAKNGGFHRNYRFPTWIRRGHVEELYELASEN